MFREIYLEFREILQKTKSKFGRKFRNFRETRYQTSDNILAILQERDDF